MSQEQGPDRLSDGLLAAFYREITDCCLSSSRQQVVIAVLALAAVAVAQRPTR